MILTLFDAVEFTIAQPSIRQKLSSWNIELYNTNSIPNVIRCYTDTHVEVCQILSRSPRYNDEAPDAYAQALLRRYGAEQAVLRFSDNAEQALIYNSKGVCIAEIVDPTPDDQQALRYQKSSLILQR